MRFRMLALAALLAACAQSAPPGSPAPASPADAVALTDTLRLQFERSAAAWNRGDLDGFMQDYARESTTSYVAGGHLRQGYEWIRSNYARNYFAPGTRRDPLRYEEFQVRPLSPTLALVTARFLLGAPGQVSASGPFTVVMERRADGWKIVHDHSSSD
jgi:ketosteroid isomerase-like protein